MTLAACSDAAGGPGASMRWVRAAGAIHSDYYAARSDRVNADGQTTVLRSFQTRSAFLHITVSSVSREVLPNVKDEPRPQRA